MINVMEREQKKVKGLIASRKGVGHSNGKSAAKLPEFGRTFNEQRVDIFVKDLPEFKPSFYNIV
ncbi:hypothetical protein AY600_16280 [Phormidium willei BDU 130791]|jgi:hypothetical protein|nr:hypothetical protein AY600_16280 [Phormidium willei BDU 130791]